MGLMGENLNREWVVLGGIPAGGSVIGWEDPQADDMHIQTPGNGRIFVDQGSEATTANSPLKLGLLHDLYQ